MSWREPTPFERAILADTEARWSEIIPLARHLILAPRIEPLLLRNVRRRFVPTAQAEVESLLWFSPLVAARSTREIVFHQGIAKALADGWRPSGDAPPSSLPAELDELWQFTRRHTRHWKPEDRLERDLRYYALVGDRQKLQAGLRDILRQIDTETSESQRIAWSRMVKRTLPSLAPSGQRIPEEARLLAQYAALALGDAGSWAQPGEPQALPAWLAAKLPSPMAQAKLGFELRQDGRHGQVLHLVAPDPSAPSIEFPSPLPARLYVAAESQAGTWHTAAIGSRIPISPPSQSLRLITLEGRQWALRADTLPDTDHATAEAPVPLMLAYVEHDRAQAQAIADWLMRQGLAVELLPESVSNVGAGTASAPARVLRLWTRAAHAYWQQRTPTEPDRLGDSLLLRTESVDLPNVSGNPGSVLELRDWASAEPTAEALKLLEQLRRWQTEGEIDRAAQTDVPAESRSLREAVTESYDEIVAKLLAEIENPATEPPRRLEIGDRLAELGDSRPGVGVREIEVPIEEIDPEAPDAVGLRDYGTYAASSGLDIQPLSERPLPPELQRLLDEIADPKTEPPRRLEIGNELDRLGDSRPGVGLRPDGIPDIDWVKIPSGSFVYQHSEIHTLPTFWMSRFPVTNLQFQAFIDAGGYLLGPTKTTPSKLQKDLFELHRNHRNKRLDESLLKDLWQQLIQPEPEKSYGELAQYYFFPEGARKAFSGQHGNHPKTDVNWFEAVAFTRWLSLALCSDNTAIRLPTEYEWEKAARGKNGLIYPWGGEFRSGFANTNETKRNEGPWYLKGTTAVGLFPHGRSPYEIDDLAGTVWEWCLNEYDKPDASEFAPNNAERALRGGSWDVGSGDARADGRGRSLPSSRFSDWGFRVVSSVPLGDED